MFGLWGKIRTGKKGQLASLLTVLLVVFLIFAFVSVNLGRLGLSRTKLSNAADAASLAAGSAASQLMNYMAGYNEMMLANFAGFTTQAMLMIVLWLVDFARVIIGIVAIFTSHPGGPVGVAFMGTLAADAINSLALDTLLIGLAIDGVTRVGNSVIKRINELNVQLPEVTRNTTRQYAFMNAGIDQPKIEYEDWLTRETRSPSDLSWEDYVEEETTFAVFMRTLSQTNDEDHPRYDPDFGPNNMISFDWDDARSGQLVNNRVEVRSIPMQPLTLRTIDFGTIAFNSGLRSELLHAISDVGLSWWMQGWVQFAISLSAGVVIMLEIIRASMIAMLVLLVALLIAVLYFLIGAYEICSIWFCACCVQLAGGIAAVILLAIYAVMLADMGLPPSPSDIPCFVYGEANNDLTSSADIQRITSGGETNYGFWQMQNPLVTAFSKAGVSGTGGPRLFPPKTDYWPEIIQTR